MMMSLTGCPYQNRPITTANKGKERQMRDIACGYFDEYGRLILLGEGMGEGICPFSGDGSSCGRWCPLMHTETAEGGIRYIVICNNNTIRIEEK